MNEATKVLDHGFVRLVDHMGGDLAISRSARVSYDAPPREEDSRLINYLWKNGHTTPFESTTMTFEVKAPIFVLRQWHRHRTQCLAGDTKLRFLRPVDGKPYQKTLSEVYEQWNTPETPVKRPDKQARTMREFKRDQIRGMRLACISGGEMSHTSIVDCWQSGEKTVYKMTAVTGESIRASKDHRFYTTKGWLRLEQLRPGCSIYGPRQIGVAASLSAPPEFSEEELETEEWLDSSIPNMSVSSLGRVRRRHKIIEPTINTSGRAMVSGKAGGKWQPCQVSRMVAEAFFGKQELLVLHRDDNPQNNRISNLRYGTHRDNHDDAKKNGRRRVLQVGDLVIESIVEDGKEQTYDIEVAHPEHNFIAEGFCTHNSYNELSARYKPLPEEFYVPETSQITTQSSDNKQMRTDEQHPQADAFRINMKAHNRNTFALYKALLDGGCPRELARSVLPVATYSHMFTTMNLLNLFKFLKERLHPHAQYEIQVYAQAMLEMVREIAPIAVGVFEEGLDDT